MRNIPSPGISSTGDPENLSWHFKIWSSHFCGCSVGKFMLILGGLRWGMDLPGSQHTHEKKPPHLSSSQPVVTEPRLPETLWVKLSPTGTELIREPTSLPSPLQNVLSLPEGRKRLHLKYIIPIRGRDDVAAAPNCCSGNGVHDSATTSGVKLDKSKTL